MSAITFSVQLLDGAWMMPNHSAGVPTYPAVYRQHVYFLSSVEARKQFTENPIAYLCQPTPKPAVQIRIAVIGPPKSGKTTC
jgi:adenylate/nucleoside-diphosphate kinase